MTTSYYPAKSPGISEITFVPKVGYQGTASISLYRMGHKRKRIPRSDPDLGKARHSPHGIFGI